MGITLTKKKHGNVRSKGRGVKLKDTTNLLQFIPMVFITNDVFVNLAQAQIKRQVKVIIDLAEELFPLVSQNYRLIVTRRSGRRSNIFHS